MPLHLAGGVTLDLCDITALGPAWLPALVFRDRLIEGKTLMEQRSGVVIAVLAAAVVVLAVALIFVIARDRDQGANGMAMVSGSGSRGMMGAMGSMDSDAMLVHMREALGDDGYQRMLQHFRDHRAGTMTANPAIDGMMHQMMDGMMQQMPDDHEHMMPRPTASGTPTR